MSLKNGTPFIASADATQCLDAHADGFNFLSIGSNDNLHQFVTSFITECVKSNTNKNKKEGKEENGNLSQQI